MLNKLSLFLILLVFAVHIAFAEVFMLLLQNRFTLSYTPTLSIFGVFLKSGNFIITFKNTKLNSHKRMLIRAQKKGSKSPLFFISQTVLITGLLLFPISIFPHLLEWIHPPMFSNRYFLLLLNF